MLKHIISISLSVLFYLGSLSAQTFNKTITPSNNELSPKTSSDTLKILAVLVDFQEDKDPATFGNGKFGSMYSKNYGVSIPDPLPHDKDYFSLHLDFAANYFRKVSEGKLNIAYNVLPGVITVSKKIRDYSPAVNSNDFSLLGGLTKEVWAIVATQNPAINFNDYDLFTVFHAGVGREFSLPGSLGTERDLPSIYLSDNVLRNMFPADQSGLPLNRQGKFNTMLIPETESRETTDITGAVSLVKFSINGIIAASIGSHLGLPDLFDTKTGLSAIGRFGLMDGQAFFAYNGVFPPEPSPWEKMYLGWLTPVEIGAETKSVSGTDHISLAVKNIAQSGDTTVIKVPVSSTEYYLVENRSRDALNNGSVITYYSNGQKLTRQFGKDTTGFYSYDIDSLKGVITDVDEFDWALPGSGIVIWHIDENVINAKIAVNQINTDKFNRGVDVEEADGVQEIGEKFYTVFGDQVIGEGSDVDFWFKGNSSKLFKNRFDYNTLPPAKSNSGAASLFSFSNFPVISNKMSFDLSRDFIIKSVASKKLDIQDPAVFFTTASANYFYAVVNDSLYKFAKDGSLIYKIADFSTVKPSVFTINETEYIAGGYQNNLNILTSDATNIPQLFTQDAGQNITTAPVIRLQSADRFDILFGTDKGTVFAYSLSATNSFKPVLLQKDILDSTYTLSQIMATDSGYYQAEGVNAGHSEYKLFDSRNNSVIINGGFIQATLTKDKSGNYITVILNNSNQLFLAQDAHAVRNITPAQPDLSIGSFALGDLRKEGENNIVFASGNYLYAVNLSGAVLDHFPFEDPKGIGFYGMPLIAGAARSTESVYIYAFTKDGRIYELDGRSGAVTHGFPVTTGSRLSASPAFYVDGDKLMLALVTNNNYYFSYNTNLIYKNSYWMQQNGNPLNSAFVQQASGAAMITQFMPKERAYNWPNPVYGSETNIRYYVSEDSRINIKIFDLAGGFVAELNSGARGGFDSETVWSVNGIQSGVYLARVEAEGISGKRETSIIKIAVVK
ncbi:MAG: hypothetical protein WCJ01_04845 [Ignavibacteria bacterium]